jgi:hypothetical protein
LINFFKHEAFKDYAYTFLSVVVFMFVADGADIFAISPEDLRSWVAAGLGAALRPIIAALDVKDTRYGLKK